MTPRARGGGRKTPSEAKKKRPAPPATITNTPITTTPSTKGAGTPSPVKEKEALAKESPNKNQRGQFSNVLFLPSICKCIRSQIDKSCCFAFNIIL